MSIRTATERFGYSVLDQSSTSTLGSTILGDLARVIVAASKQEITPVLVTNRIRLADEFYVELCAVVYQRSGCHVRLDLLQGHRLAGRFCSQRHSVSRLNRRLPAGCSAVHTLVISRNQPPLSELVIGFAGPNDHLPLYAKSIELYV